MSSERTTGKSAAALNGICPYFTMFPLAFPSTVLRTRAAPGDWVCDPFCGRGTTNYASRMLGLPSIGIDSNPVAVALSQAKLANTNPIHIMQVAHRILDEVAEPGDVPQGEFWEWAFYKDVLHTLCRFREGLLKNCRSDARKALRAIMLGALHGPRQKQRASYFSNQSQRTYAPKPRYAVSYWKARNLIPQPVDVLDVIGVRAQRYYANETTKAVGRIIAGDSRDGEVYDRLTTQRAIRWVITSPPYYGLNTYLPDQWLRSWFLGGPAQVDYSTQGQISHAGPEIFASQLGEVWQHVGGECAAGAKMVIRFGAINDRKVDALELLKQSLYGSGWEITDVQSAGSASSGHRQALHFSPSRKSAIEEYDVWGVWRGANLV
ncbi:MAG TPA: DNA methyltransferase [Ktedonobacteraceae bacterium]|nr:DNA methyltransferase [Ktedonobacteraceae bacterium]